MKLRLVQDAKFWLLWLIAGLWIASRQGGIVDSLILGLFWAFYGFENLAKSIQYLAKIVYTHFAYEEARREVKEPTIHSSGAVCYVYAWPLIQWLFFNCTSQFVGFEFYSSDGRLWRINYFSASAATPFFGLSLKDDLKDRGKKP